MQQTRQEVPVSETLSPADHADFILLLWEMELAKAQLYDKFGRVFAWEGKRIAELANAKRCHAQRIIVVKFYLQNRMLTPGRPFPQLTVKSFISFIEHLLHRMEKGELSFREGLHYALALEKMSTDLLLRKYFHCHGPQALKTIREFDHGVRQQRMKLLRLLESADTPSLSAKQYNQPCRAEFPRCGI